MIATPAWPPQSTPRLFVETELAPGSLRIDGPAAHYLIAVMRLKAGDPVKLFDDATGEWLAVAASVARRDLTLDVAERRDKTAHRARPDRRRKRFKGGRLQHLPREMEAKRRDEPKKKEAH